MRERAAEKAARYLSEGRVILREVRSDRVSAVARGDGAIHAQEWTPAGGWSCSCPASSTACANLQAVRLVVAIDLPTPRGHR